MVGQAGNQRETVRPSAQFDDPNSNAMIPKDTILVESQRIPAFSARKRMMYPGNGPVRHENAGRRQFPRKPPNSLEALIESSRVSG